MEEELTTEQITILEEITLSLFRDQNKSSVMWRLSRLRIDNYGSPVSDQNTWYFVLDTIWTQIHYTSNSIYKTGMYLAAHPYSEVKQAGYVIRRVVERNTITVEYE
jgi:hypothetical protein